MVVELYRTARFLAASLNQSIDTTEPLVRRGWFRGSTSRGKKNRWFLVICSSNRTSDPLNQLIIGWFNRSYKHSTTMVVIQFVSLVNITKLPGQLGFPETYGRIDWVKPTNTIAVEYSLGIHLTIALITINIHKPGASRF